MARLYDYLSAEVPLRFGEAPIDLYNQFTDRWRSRSSGTTMPPSPSAISYAMFYKAVDEGLEFKVRMQWHPIAYEVAKRVYPHQIWHRSRAPAVAFSRGQVHELDHRIEQSKTLLPKLREAAATPRISHELYTMVLEELKRHLRINKTHIKKYIDEHRTRSLGSGHKWREAYSLTDSELKSILQILLQNIEELEANEGKHSQLKYFTGIRARAESLDAFREEYEFKISRSRIITFHPGMSIWTMFIPEKVSFYDSVLTKTAGILHSRPKYIFPFIRGGRMYQDVSDMFANGDEFIAADGKSWDSSVGILMGPSFSPFMFNVAGLPMLGSGITLTSLFGTQSQQIVMKDVDGTIVGLGDDINQFNCKNVPKYPFIEVQPDDTRFRHVLGLIFVVPRVPRITGLKASSDRGDLTRPLIIDRDERNVVQTKNRDNRIRALYAGLPFGNFAGRTLLEAVNDVSAGEFKGGFTEMIEEMAEIEVNSETADVYSWAKENNVAEVFG